jgi:hypothetical protein
MTNQRLCAAALCCALLFSSGPLRGAAATETQILRDVVNVFPGDVNPCTGEAGTSTFTFDGVAHITVLPNGDAVVKVTLTGRLEVVPDDPSLPSLSGHFVSNSISTLNQGTGTQTATFITKLTGSDGSTERFHVVAHITLNDGEVSVAFERPRCY